ncbi:MAG TPA: hypothetical protein VIW25_01245 [Nitrososphaeraceae archaeon]|jgi:hypothetical protein
MIFLFAAQVSTSLPVRYQKFGCLIVKASKITFETTSTGEPLYAIWFEFAAIFYIICEYGELGSCAFFGITIEFAKLVLMKPGSIKTTFIPKSSNSYAIDSDKPLTANLVLT